MYLSRSSYHSLRAANATLRGATGDVGFYSPPSPPEYKIEYMTIDEDVIDDITRILRGKELKTSDDIEHVLDQIRFELEMLLDNVDR